MKSYEIVVIFNEGVEQLSKFDAIFLGAVGSPEASGHISL